MTTNMIENPVRQPVSPIFRVLGTWPATPQKIFGVEDALELAGIIFSERSDEFCDL